MILILAACVDPEGVAPESPADTAERLADTAPILPAPDLVAQFDQAGVEAALVSAASNGMIWPLQLHAWYEGLMDDTQLGRGICPVRNPSKEDPEVWTSYWSGPCEGRHYTIDGDWIAYVTRRGTAEGEEFMASDLWSLTGTVTATGEEVYAGGHAELHWESTATSATFELFYGGQYLDPSWVGPMRTGVDGGLWVRGNLDVATGFDGQLAGAVLGAGNAIDFRTVTFSRGAPADGVIAVRDPSSGWWTITLGHDGCGPLDWQGTVVGTTCIANELTAILAEPAAASLAAPP